jgi:uncharacterized protein
MPSDDNMWAVRRLYDAFNAQDAGALLAVLAPGFRGVVSDGMPDGLGGSYEGPETMLHDCWARVFALMGVRPVPDEYLPAGRDRIVVVGRYLGIARASGRPLSAAFAHVLRFADGLVTDWSRSQILNAGMKRWLHSVPRQKRAIGRHVHLRYPAVPGTFLRCPGPRLSRIAVSPHARCSV